MMFLLGEQAAEGWANSGKKGRSETLDYLAID
jgi:hypothetical protein